MSENSLSKLKKKRCALRVSFTKSLDELQDELPKVGESNVCYLEELLETLTQNYESLSVVDAELEKSFPVEPYLKKSEEYRRKAVHGKFREVLKSYPSFESEIHYNGTLDKTDKFNYLKAYLGGSVSNTVEGLPITPSTNDSVIKLLKERFAVTDLLVHSHMSNLLNIKPLSSCNDVYAFRKNFDKISIELRSLENMGQPLKDLSSILCTAILKSLFKDILMEINSSEKVYTDLKKLLFFHSRERAETIKFSF
ncbi:uncharacterized protein TNIN_318691 [Trichonephila inaurata madagascariensis]|uniref:Uncharacterized protein n=1 Tax=Trichonephila inaurata madagascariensis TaxID=2747483 RepID=A0A8X7CC28_9ARAC|nr:uncharacterized protein TNIN_318691 [Trichonephila inaurata madagascariensis]